MLTVEAGGLVKGRNLNIISDVVKVDKKGTISVSGQGLSAGEGAGSGRAGGSFGGRGGLGDTGGMSQLCESPSHLKYQGTLLEICP